MLVICSEEYFALVKTEQKCSFRLLVISFPLPFRQEKIFHCQFINALATNYVLIVWALPLVQLISCLLSFLKYLFCGLTYIGIHLSKFTYLQSIHLHFSLPPSFSIEIMETGIYGMQLFPSFFAFPYRSSFLKVRNEHKRVYFLVVFFAFHAKTFLYTYFKNLHCLSIYFPGNASILKVLITLTFSTWIMLLADEKRLCLARPPCLAVYTGTEVRHCPCCLPLTTLKTSSKSIMFPAMLWTLHKLNIGVFLLL